MSAQRQLDGTTTAGQLKPVGSARRGTRRPSRVVPEIRRLFVRLLCLYASSVCTPPRDCHRESGRLLSRHDPSLRNSSLIFGCRACAPARSGSPSSHPDDFALLDVALYASPHRAGGLPRSLGRPFPRPRNGPRPVESKACRRRFVVSRLNGRLSPCSILFLHNLTVHIPPSTARGGGHQRRRRVGGTAWSRGLELVGVPGYAQAASFRYTHSAFRSLTTGIIVALAGAAIW
jgi:hypothetical protein